MYKINHKAVMLVFLFQIVLGVIWYAATPTLFLEGSVLEGVRKLSIVPVLLLALAVYVYLLFTAWLLVKVKGMSGFGYILLVLAMWLCVVLPNYIFAGLHLSLSGSDMLYLVSYGALNSVIAAIILPLWRSSRSIFKS
ncbi:hypothetical protein HGG82_02445 [Marinomonas sp. M1K-6]|uniref:Uncharacterized protein n=1 Tax=Marinomonas profundi TaxID=2726122 RepID=A0A847QZK4_9GAMM|nr:hypothetical protein [Marinomonas profundi]NLQ16481.1 hypothetical protein [Marinomonas profundi]UDV03929.1 hypothetical protein J8N69_03910 [Marinomonas profundi]